MKQPGDRLGPYEIVEPIGKGAMAEVYRARDVRLQREVALKVLSGTAGADPAFLGRFEREARSASAIDHPNVVTVHDVGRVESTAWIALELVDGRTLREILAHERLPLRRALSLAAQIADGLAAAHDRGIVHRDLKPENIKVTHDGLVKILDFGLAKVHADQGLAGLSAGNNLTTPGVLIGTVLYMSPEQAAGKPVDFRSDQFSFAGVLFEMLTGQAPFLRDSVATTLFAIVREDPSPLPQLDPAIRVPLRWILDRCLAKDAESRYASTRDLARDLHRLSEELEHPAAAAPEAPAPASGRRARTIAVPLLAPLALFLAFLTGDRCHKSEELFFQQLTYGRGHVVSARFMPDGLTVMYSAGWEGNPFTVYRKDPQSFESLTLDVPPGWLQAVSPKGTLMLVTSPQIRLPGRPLGLLAETPYAGGLPRPVLENVQFADWDRDGNDMAVVVHRGGETVLEFPRGKKAVATTPGWITAPRVSPSGELVAFVDHPNRGDDRGYVAVVDRAGRQRLRTQLWSVARGLAWSPDGSEVWFAASPGLELSALRAVGLDGTVRMLARAPGPLALLDVSPNGDALVARETRHFCIAASLPDGSTQELSYLDSSLLADLSDDGRTMLFTEFGESGGMFHSTFLRDLGSARPVRLGDGFARALSPDSSWALSLILKEVPDLMLLPTRAGEPLRLNYGDVHYHAADFLPGGRGLLVAAGELVKGVRLYVQDLDGSAPRPVADEVISSDHYQGFPASPDGRWVATVEEDGIALRAVDHPEKRMLAGLSPGTLPIRWTSDGGALYVFRPDEVPARILRVDALTGRASPWRTIAPPDRAGVHIFPVVRLSADGRTCVYSYARLLTVLYRVTGLK